MISYPGRTDALFKVLRCMVSFSHCKMMNKELILVEILIPSLVVYSSLTMLVYQVLLINSTWLQRGTSLKEFDHGLDK